MGHKPLCPCLTDEQICLDGKTLRSSRMNGKAVHLLSAYAAKARLVLLKPGDDKSNEIRAIPELLSCLDLTGAVVTIDAIGCQKTIAEQIIQTKADKGCLEVHETVDEDHGRLEIRRYSLSRDIAGLLQQPEWMGLQAVGRVESTRLNGDKTSIECRYYLTSLTDLSRFAETVRGHWAIENSQHWVHDVQFGEDAHRARKKSFSGQSGFGQAYGTQCHSTQWAFKA